jgi:hypothetical protein
MRQEELMKEKLLAGASKIYTHHDINALLASQVVSWLPKYE